MPTAANGGEDHHAQTLVPAGTVEVKATCLGNVQVQGNLGASQAPCAVSQALGDGQQARVSTTIPTLSVTSGKDCVIESLVNNVPVSILIDMGAATSVLNKASWDRAKGSRSNLIGVDGRKLVGVQGKPLKLYGSTCVQVQLAAEKFSVEVIIAETPTADLIIGRDFLRRQECTIEIGEA